MTLCECLLGAESGDRKPADRGVVGRAARRGRESGRGREAELRRASRARCSSFDRELASSCSRDAASSADDLEPGRRTLVGDAGCGAACALDSEALAERPSLARRDREWAADTVWARAGTFLLATMGGSEMVSSIGRGFLAWATASGPAQCGRKGQATLASTKLPRTVTGRTFSVIRSCLPLSETPKTMCWTLLKTLRQVLKASVWGFGERSWR